MKKALVAALAAATFLAPACAIAQAGGESGDARILAAREALRKGDTDTLERLAAVREAHPLDAYPRYWLLVNRLARGDGGEAAFEVGARVVAAVGEAARGVVEGERLVVGVGGHVC